MPKQNRLSEATWILVDPHDDTDHEFTNIVDLAVYMLDNFDAGDTAVIFHDREL